METLSIIEKKEIIKIHTRFEDFGIHNNDIKKLFFDSFKEGYTPELIGELFERSLARIERKDKGQYYTPKSIVEYIISQLNITKDSRILDPACGCGSFLLTIFEVFKKKFGTEFLNNIFGVDINDNAINLTRACLYLEAEFNDNYINIIKKNIRTGNSIVSKKKIDKEAFDWHSEFNHVKAEGGFDFIIGNPPYVTLRKHLDFDPSESFYSKIIGGPVNAATLMIGKSLELLKEHGTLAFLLPKSILYVDSYMNLRRYIVQHTELLQIYDLGSKFKDVRGEQIILIIKKKIPTLKNKLKICVFDNKDKSLSKQPSILIQQKKLSDLDRFLTFENHKCYDLVDKISKLGIKLEDFVNGKIFRGLPLGGNYIKAKDTHIKGEEVIRGKNISKFKIKTPFIIDNDLLKKQSKTKIENLKNKKVVLQNIFSSESGVIAAYDNKKLLTLDTVTNIIVSNDEKGKYILALLNSKLINFYLIFGIYDKSKLTMHLDKSYLGLIPIIEHQNKTKFNQLVEIIDSISDSTIELKKKNKQIDIVVYDIYDLNKEEIDLIENATSRMLSRRSVW